MTNQLKNAYRRTASVIGLVIKSIACGLRSVMDERAMGDDKTIGGK